MIATDSIVFHRQAPARASYHEDPSKALILKTARTSAAPDGDPLHCLVDPGDSHGVTVRIGIDDAVGGYHDAPNPAELLCAALASCADTAIRMVADLFGVKLDNLSVEVTGEVDVRGTLAIDRSVPVGFRSLSCCVHVRPAPGTDPALLERVLVQAERACVNLQTLRDGVAIETVHEVDIPPAGVGIEKD